MWRWRGWGWDGRLGREGGGGVGGSGEGVCVRLHGLGSVDWGWRNRVLDREEVGRRVGHGGRICVSVCNRGMNLCKGRRQIWFSG
jgi:hypothetical protein